MPAHIHVGDVGTELVVQVVDENAAAVDVSAATSLTIFLKQPGENGSVLTKTAVLDTTGTDGKIKYTTVAGDIGTDGVWTIQGRVTVGGSTWSTAESRFVVKPNLA